MEMRVIRGQRSRRGDLEASIGDAAEHGQQLSQVATRGSLAWQQLDNSLVHGYGFSATVQAPEGVGQCPLDTRFVRSQPGGALKRFQGLSIPAGRQQGTAARRGRQGDLRVYGC
jgi:hypothetical protein